MAKSAKYCRSCGAPHLGRAKACRKCDGKLVHNLQASVEAQEKAHPERGMRRRRTQFVINLLNETKFGKARS